MIRQTDTERILCGALLALTILIFLMPAVNADVGVAFKIETDPVGAHIYIDDYYRGISGNDTVFYGLDAGEHTILLTLDGYQPYETVKTVSPGASELVYHKFKPIPTKGQVDFSSSPSGADIIFDGKNIGKTPYTLENVDPGTYTVVLKLTGYDDWRGSVNVEVGMISNVDANLVPAKPPLSVKTSPDGFDLYIDDVYVGKTPYSGMIPQGEHVLRVEKFGYLPVEETVYAGSDGISRVYTPETTLVEAIAEVEALVDSNGKYSPLRAKELLEDARSAYASQNYDEAIALVQEARNAATDIDQDGVDNADDIFPEVSNYIICLISFILLVVIILIALADLGNCSVKPEIDINVPKLMSVDKKNPYVKLTISAKGGRYREFFCMVTIDGILIDRSFSKPDSYFIALSDEQKSVGEHKVVVDVNITQIRYGVSSARSEKTYIIYDNDLLYDPNYYTQLAAAKANMMDLIKDE